MQSDLEKRIEEERALIVSLDSTLDANRTLYMKRQLRFGMHTLDDAVLGLRHAKENPKYEDMWIGFAEMNFQIASQIRQKVQAAVDKFGGPNHIIEMGG